MRNQSPGKYKIAGELSFAQYTLAGVRYKIFIHLDSSANADSLLYCIYTAVKGRNFVYGCACVCVRVCVCVCVCVCVRGVLCCAFCFAINGNGTTVA